jgi:hypothetical protein
MRETTSATIPDPCANGRVSSNVVVRSVGLAVYVPGKTYIEQKKREQNAASLRSAATPWRSLIATLERLAQRVPEQLFI